MAEKKAEKNDNKSGGLCSNVVLSSNEYRSEKRMLIAEEKNNFDRIMAIKCSGDGNWFEIADHSALIFYYYVASALKLKVKFADDFDSFYEQYAIGRIRVRDIDSIRRYIEKAEKVRMVRTVGGRVTFYLERDFSTVKMEELRNREVKRRLDLNRTIDVSNQADPLFYRNLGDVMKTLHRMCLSRMDKLSSQTNGARIVELADTTMTDYIHSTELPGNFRELRIEDWKNIRGKLHQLKYEIQAVIIAGVWDPEKCLKVMEKIIELQKAADKNLAEALSIKGMSKKIVTRKGENEKTED